MSETTDFLNLPYADTAPQTLAYASDAAHLLSVLPTIKDQIGRMERTLDNRMLQRQREGSLTPEVAQQAWLEKTIYRQIIGGIEQKIRAAGLQT